MWLIYKWICEKFSYRFDGLSKTLLFYFSYFDFEYFLTSFHPFLWLISNLCINCYPVTKIWGLEIFDSETTVLKIFLKICTFSLFIFIKQKNYCNVLFNDTYKNVLLSFVLMKFEALWNDLFEIRGRQKLSLFNISFWNSFQILLLCQFLRSQTCYY